MHRLRHAGFPRKQFKMRAGYISANAFAHGFVLGESEFALVRHFVLPFGNAQLFVNLAVLFPCIRRIWEFFRIELCARQFFAQNVRKYAYYSRRYNKRQHIKQ